MERQADKYFYATMIVVVLLASILAYYIAKMLLLKFLKTAISKSKTIWDGILSSAGYFLYPLQVWTT